MCEEIQSAVVAGALQIARALPGASLQHEVVCDYALHLHRLAVKRRGRESGAKGGFLRAFDKKRVSPDGMRGNHPAIYINQNLDTDRALNVDLPRHCWVRWLRQTSRTRGQYRRRNRLWLRRLRRRCWRRICDWHINSIPPVSSTICAVVRIRVG